MSHIECFYYYWRRDEFWMKSTILPSWEVFIISFSSLKCKKTPRYNEKNRENENQKQISFHMQDVLCNDYMPTPSSEIVISEWCDEVYGLGVDFFTSSPVYESTSARSAPSHSLWVLSPGIFLSAMYPWAFFLS